MSGSVRSSSLRVVLSHTYSWPEVRRGGERYLHELSAALADAGHRVTVLTSGSPPGRREVLGVPVVAFRRRSLAARRFGYCAPEVGFAASAAAWVTPRRIDVWHALGAPDATAATALGRRRRFRSVYTVLGVPDRPYHETRPDRSLHDYVVRKADEYICLSAAAGRALQVGWGRTAVVLGGGVDTRRFAPAGRRHDRPALLYSGSFDTPNKNLPLLIDAMGLLVKRVPGIELWLSGQGSVDALLAGAPAPVRQAVRPLGVGAEEEQAGRYGTAWATVLPSENEAFGLCLVESLACGTPIVVLAAGGGPAEIVTPETGVASPKSAEDLARSCQAALDMAARPGTADACRAEAEKYDWRKSVVPRLEAIYAR